MVLIENEGALFRGPARGLPKEVWSEKAQAWKPYEGETPKPIEWGNIINEEEAKLLMGAPTADAA